MPRTRDPNFTTGHLCRFCGELIPWGTILRIIRTDVDTPGFMLNETAAHTGCLRKVLRPEVELNFHRHWNGKAPMPDDSEDIFLPLDGGGQEGVTPEPRSTSADTPPQPSPSRGGSKALHPCAICGKDIAPDQLVRLRVQKPIGPVKAPQFDEQSLPVHFECLAAVSTMRLG